MTKLINRITSDNFQFLKSTKGATGSVRSSLTVEELDRFCSIMYPVIECMSWKAKVDRETVRKVVTILKQAADSARKETECSNELPFNI